MSKDSIDYASLGNKIYKRAYKLSEVKEDLETIAFDIVRFRGDDNSANLWQIQSSDDGDYIVAMYEPEEKVANVWEVVINKSAGDLQVSYKGDPIVRVSSSKLGIPPSELSKVEVYLPEKLATNKKLVKALLNELQGSAKKAVLSKYPELAE